MTTYKNWEKLSSYMRRKIAKQLKGTPTFPHKSNRRVFYVFNGKKYTGSYFDSCMLFGDQSLKDDQFLRLVNG